MSERWMERLLALIREGVAEEEREKLWRAYEAAARALVEYGKVLTKGTKGGIDEETVRLAADAAVAAFEYNLLAALEGGREAVADALAKLDERLLVVLAARLAVRRERGERVDIDWGG